MSFISTGPSQEPRSGLFLPPFVINSPTFKSCKYKAESVLNPIPTCSCQPNHILTVRHQPAAAAAVKQAVGMPIGTLPANQSLVEESQREQWEAVVGGVGRSRSGSRRGGISAAFGTNILTSFLGPILRCR